MDICISEDVFVSGDIHCTIVYDNHSNCFYLTAGKENFTYLNGNLLLEACKLKEGDVLRIGHTSLEFIPFCRGDKKWEEI